MGSIELLDIGVARVMQAQAAVAASGAAHSFHGGLRVMFPSMVGSAESAIRLAEQAAAAALAAIEPAPPFGDMAQASARQAVETLTGLHYRVSDERPVEAAFDVSAGLQDAGRSLLAAREALGIL